MTIPNRPHTRAVALAATALLITSLACSGDPTARRHKLIESGDAYVASKNYPEAIIQYRNAVALDGGNGEARAKLAAAYEAGGDPANALREYVRAADLLPDDVDVQLHAGKLLVAAGQFPEGRARAMAALEKDPKNVNGLIVLGNALAGLKDIDGAIDQLEQAIDANPQLTFAYTNVGVLELKSGDKPAAQQAFERAVQIQPKSITARLNLANFYWASRQLPLAERELKETFALDPNSEVANRMLGVFYLSTGRQSEAEPLLKRFADLTADVRGKFALADLYRSTGRKDEAIRMLEPLTTDPKNRDAMVGSRLRLAVLDFESGNRKAAYATLEDLLKLYRDDRETLESKARFLAAEGKNDEAIAVADAVIKAEPASPASLFIKAVALEAKGSIPDAIASAHKVLELTPSAVPAQFLLARLSLARGDVKSAMEYLNPLLKAQPNAAVLHMLYARAQLAMGNLKVAEAELTALTTALPRSAELHTYLGQVYGTQGDARRARQAFSRALELDPNSLLALNGIVALDLIEKRPDVVRQTLEPRLAARPDDEPLLFLAANSFIAIGDTGRGESLLRKVLELNPANLNAYSRLGGLYVSQHRLDQAREEFEAIAKKQAKPVVAKTFVGMIYEMQDRPDDARKAYEDVLSFNPRAAVAANNLALYHAAKGDLDVALQLAQTAKATLPNDARVNDTLGWVYYQKGLASLAITSLEQSVELNPNSAESHYHLAMALLKNGDHQKARQSLERALKLNANFADAADARRLLATMKG